MKILNVNMTIDPVRGGGGAARTLQMSLHLAKKGVKCDILTTDIGVNPEYIRSIEKEGVNIYALQSINNRFYLPKYSLKTISTLVQQADIIHLMSHWTVLNVLVYSAAKKLKKSYVVCPAGSLPIYGRSKTIKRLYNRIIGKKLVREADGHIAITAEEIRQLNSYGVDEDSVCVIPNGVDAAHYKIDSAMDFRSKYGLGNDPFVLFVGRLNSIKGPDILLRAFCNIRERLRNYHLVLVGPDEGLLSKLQRITSEFNAKDHVHFLGYLSEMYKIQAYYAAELLVIPSRQEAMSIVVLEAGITGTPVLMTDQCGFSEIADVKGGMVVSASIDGIQKGLFEMLSDPAKLKLMGISLRRHTEAHFEWETIVDKYLELYSRILCGRAETRNNT